MAAVTPAPAVRTIGGASSALGIPLNDSTSSQLGLARVHEIVLRSESSNVSGSFHPSARSFEPSSE